jgi:hypothetical protein
VWVRESDPIPRARLGVGIQRNVGDNRATRQGEDMRHAQRLLAAAVASIAGKNEERAVASLFSQGGTHALKGEFAGINEFEVVAYLVVLPKAH